MDQNTVFLLIGGAIVLGLIGVLIDRINFPQKRFRPKAVTIDPKAKAGASRDRAGAHIIDVTSDEIEDEEQG